MPYMKNGVRDVKRQNELYDSKPRARKARAEGVKIQRDMEKAGRANKGDGLDNAHKRAFSKGGSSDLENITKQKPSTNRSFARTKSGKMK
jgi:hypothetical protein